MDLEQIENKINAYHMGWICYDKEHVRELQKMREVIIDQENQSGKISQNSAGSGK